MPGLTPEAISRASQAAQTIQDVYWPAWQSHPDFAAASRWCEQDPNDPAAVALYRHEPFHGHRYSYMIAPVFDLLAPAQLTWGEKTLGEFVCILPIRDDLPVHPTRIGYIRWSLKGAGKAFRARQVLREMLPAKYRPLISLARSFARTPKSAYLPIEWKLAHRGQVWRQSEMPEWYRYKTRDRLNFESFCEKYRERLAGIEAHIGRESFWICATGQIHPDDVFKHLTYQLQIW